MLAIFSLTPGLVHACSCSFSDKTYSAEELEADGIVIVRGRAATEKNASSGRVYEFEVEKVLVGTVAPRISIATGHGGGDCGVSIPTNKTTNLVLFELLRPWGMGVDADYGAGICSQLLLNRVRGMKYWLRSTF